MQRVILDWTLGPEKSFFFFFKVFSSSIKDAIGTIGNFCIRSINAIIELY